MEILVVVVVLASCQRTMFSPLHVMRTKVARLIGEVRRLVSGEHGSIRRVWLHLTTLRVEWMRSCSAQRKHRTGHR